MKQLEIKYTYSTFNCCDNNFSQFYTIHEFKNNFDVSLMFCFLQDKTFKSFRSKFISNFYHHHPNVFKIIKVLKMFQTKTFIKIRTSDINRPQRINKINKIIETTQY